MKRKQRNVSHDEVDEAPPPLRHCGPKGFHAGSLKYISMTNFMSYNHASFSPGPHLNLILAPNGCGKSTIVAAICLGLAGQITLLGKSNQVKDFIQRGKPFAEVELELYASDNAIVKIRRHIAGNHSKWYINGKETGEKDVRDLVDKLNIKLDNLTQFLPQERVKSFSQLSPVELLEQTEEAILPPEVVQLHAKLILASKDRSQQEKQLEQLEKKCQYLKDCNQVDARDVERHQQQQLLLRQAAEFTLGTLYAQHCAIKEEGKRLKAELNARCKELDEQKAGIKPLTMARTKAENDFRDHSAELEKWEGTRALGEEGCARHQKEFDKLTQEVTSLLLEESHLAERDKRRLTDIERLGHQKDGLEQELMALQPPQALEPELAKKMEEIKRCDLKYTELGAAIDELDARITHHTGELGHLDAQIRELNNVKEQRLQAVRSQKSHCYDVWRWVQQNVNHLQGKVYLPALEVNITNGDQNTWKYLEMVMPAWIKLGFICEKSRDKELISSEMRDKQKKSFSITTRELTLEDKKEPRRLCDIRILRAHGVTHWLDQAITAPDIIMASLRDAVPIHLIAVAQHDVDMKALRQLCPDLQTVFSPNHRYTCRTSRYGQRLVSTSVDQLWDPTIFRGVAQQDTGPLEEQSKRLKQTLYELQVGKTTKKADQNKVRSERELHWQAKTQLSNQQQKYNQVKRAIEQKSREIQRLEKEENLEAERSRISNSVQQKNQKRVELLAALRTTAAKQVEAIRQLGLLQCKGRTLQRTLEEMRQKELAAEQQLRGITAQRDEMKRQCEQAGEQLKKIGNEFQLKRGEFIHQWGVDLETVNNTLRTMSCDLEWLRAEVRRCESEADAIVADPQKVQEFKKRKAEIEALTREIDTFKRGLEERTQNMETWKKKWIDPLQASITKLDERFQEYCKYQGIRGKVDLESPRDANGHELPGQFQDYSIQLKCGFRSGDELQRLTGQRQSGGERAVVTILYLLALQSMNLCPFRVVDEIDQGMDAKNQRKVFLKMLESSAAGDAPQSFLITPKFLPNMVPENACHLDIFFVFNGPHSLLQETCNAAQDTVKQSEVIDVMDL